MKFFKEPTRIFGILLLCLALFLAGRNAISDMEIKELTPDKCTMEAEGRVVDSVYGSKLSHGSKNISTHL